MALSKSLMAMLLTFSLAQAGPCKPSTTTSSAPAATTTACTPGLINPTPAGEKCGLVGAITSDNAYVGFGASYYQSIDRCLLGCSLTSWCEVVSFIPGQACSYFAASSSELTTDGYTGYGSYVYEIGCYQFCD